MMYVRISWLRFAVLLAVVFGSAVLGSLGIAAAAIFLGSVQWLAVAVGIVILVLTETFIISSIVVSVDRGWIDKR